MQQYDAIIIGAGISGLTAANYLARHGVKTMIYEQSDHVGGYVSSFRRGKYTFDAGLTSFGSNGIVIPILQELEVGNQVELVPVTRRLITDDLQARVDRSLRPFAEELSRVFPQESEGIQRYFRQMDIICQGFRRLCESPIFLGEWNRSRFSWVRLLVQEYPFLRSLLAMRNKTKQSLHQEYFQNLELRALLDRQGYPVMSAIVLAGMWYSFAFDYWYPLGGMQSVSDLLWREYSRLGGETTLRTKVERILTRAGKVHGVRLANGQDVEARAVFACLDLRTTWLNLLQGQFGEAAFLNRLHRGHPSESAFSLYLGLKGKGFHRSPYPLDASHNWFYITGAGGQKWEFAMNILTLEDPTLAEDGESVTVTCFEQYDDWSGLQDRSELYYRKKGERMEKMLIILRQILPDLDERLEVLDAASPLTYESYTGNYQGATAGWSWNPRYQPHFHWWREGKIPGLYLCGQWLRNPGGLPTAMLTARGAAQSFLRKLSNFRGNST